MTRKSGVELAIGIADDRFAVGIHATAGAPLPGLWFDLCAAATIAQAKQGEKHEEQKRDCDQEGIPIGEKSICGQKTPPDVTAYLEALSPPKEGLGGIFSRSLILDAILQKNTLRRGAAEV